MDIAPVPRASTILTAAFLVLPGIVAAVLVALYARARTIGGRGPSVARAALGLGAWMALTAVIAAAGVLARFDRRPPPLALLLAAMLALSLGLALSRIGAAFSRLPLEWLVGLNAFRLPLELAMHRAVDEGVMPRQMSFSGWNFDIVTGLTALVVAFLLARRSCPRALVVAWNALGSVLLAAILVIAVASTPMVRAFGGDPASLNTFVVWFPFVWLPTVLVPAAIFLHVVIARALRATRGGAA